MPHEADLTPLLGDLPELPGVQPPPIDAEELRARRGAVVEALDFEEGLLLEAGGDFRWLCGFDWHLSERFTLLALVPAQPPLFVVPRLEAALVEKAVASWGERVEIAAWNEDEDPIRSLCEARPVPSWRVGENLRHRVVKALEGRGGRRIQEGAALLRKLRARKSSHEIALLRRASEITQHALAIAGERIEVGMSERFVARLVHGIQERLGLQGVWELVLSGPSSAEPHGRAGERSLQRGDPLLVDTGGSLHGYQSDTTRSWAVAGEVCPEFGRAWESVRAAQERGFESLRRGRACHEIDAAARRELVARGHAPGYADFVHRLGHGIGVEGHEFPYLCASCDEKLEAGMCFSNEPGLYFPGRFGVRIEDIVLVTETGADHFGRWQSGPEKPD